MESGSYSPYIYVSKTTRLQAIKKELEAWDVSLVFVKDGFKKAQDVTK